jgi:hypothetical protein
MRNILGKIILASAAIAAAAFTTTAATAETLNVPFNFTVAGKICPAGSYSIHKTGSSNVVTLQSKSTSQTFLWTLRPGSPAATDTRVLLTFDKIGDMPTLHSVQYGPMVTSTIDKTVKPIDRATRITLGE